MGIKQPLWRALAPREKPLTHLASAAADTGAVSAACCAPATRTRFGDFYDMRLQALQTRTPSRAQAAVPDRAAVIPATGLASGDDGLGIRAIFSLPATWWRRARFRAELRADLRDKPELLRDIG